MATTTKASKPAAVHFRLPEVVTAQDHPFSWVIAERADLNNSSDSLTGSNETHQSSSVASADGDLAGESTLSPPTRSKKAAALLGEPLIASPNQDLPLRGAQQASARKAALTKPKPKPVESPTKHSAKSMGFMFTKRSKSPGPPSSRSAAPIEPMPAVPPPPSAEVRAQAPIHARFAKANRESWIEKKGSRGAVKGPIIPSRRGAPTLSFIAQLPEPEDRKPIAYVPAPARSGTSRSGGSERARSPVQRAISPVQCITSPAAVFGGTLPDRSANSAARVESPPPIAELDGSVSASAIINIAYPRPAKGGSMDSISVKPAPTGPLPLPPLVTTSPPRAVSPLPPRMTSPVQRTTTASPPGIMSPTVLSPTSITSGRATPTLPISGKYQVTIQKREVARAPSAYQSVPEPMDESELSYTRGRDRSVAASAPGSPIQRQDLPRAFSPAPSVESGLRRTPSLPPAKREQSPSLVRGRDHPFPTRPVERQRSANVNVPTFHLSVDGTDDPRLARVGFYMSPGSISATDVSTASLHRLQQRDRDLLSVDPFTRVSDAPSSIYSDLSTGDLIERQPIMSEDEHGLRRQNLIQNVGRLVLSDGRVLV